MDGLMRKIIPTTCNGKIKREVPSLDFQLANNVEYCYTDEFQSR